MYYLSTRNNKLEESFENILFQGLSKEGGLFLPSVWPKINLNEIDNKNYHDGSYDYFFEESSENEFCCSPHLDWFPIVSG